MGEGAAHEVSAACEIKWSGRGWRALPRVPAIGLGWLRVEWHLDLMCSLSSIVLSLVAEISLGLLQSISHKTLI